VASPALAMLRGRNSPALIVLLLLALFVGLTQLGQVATRQRIPMVNPCDDVSVDFREVYLAALYLRIGWNPSEVQRCVYPPLPAQINVPVTYLPYDVVKYLVPPSLLIAVLAALLLLHRVFTPSSLPADLIFTLTTLGTLSLSYPFRFLFDRGNLDGFVMLLAALGLRWLSSAGFLAGLMFGLAAAVKVYPALLALALLAGRRWRPLASMAALLFVLFELSMALWLYFGQERVFDRGEQFRLGENGSLAVTFTYLEWLAPRALGREVPEIVHASPSTLAQPFYLGLLSLMVWRDLRERNLERRQLCAEVMLYFPFLVAIPQLAYQYELNWLITMLPAVGWLASRSRDRTQQALLWLIVTGVALGQFHAVAAQRLLDSVAPYVVPGFGLLLVIVVVVALRWHEVRRDGGLRAGLDRLRARMPLRGR